MSINTSQRPTFGFIPPDKNWAYRGVVTGDAGDVLHQLSYLTDGQNGLPLRKNSGSGSWTVTGLAAGLVDTVAICNHRIKVAVTLGGDVSGSLTPIATPPNDVLFNPWVAVTPEPACTAIDIDITANPEDIVIGELVAGELVEFPQPEWSGEAFDTEDFSDSIEELALLGLNPYDPMAEARRWRGSLTVDTTQLAILHNWRRAQRAFSRPSLIIPDLLVNDAWLGAVVFKTYTSHEGRGLWDLELRIVEYPRYLW